MVKSKTSGFVKLLRLITGIAVALLLFSILSFLLFQRYLNKRLPRFVAEKSENLYVLDFSDIKLGIFPLSIHIENLSLKPNDTISNRLSKKFPEKSLYTLHSSSLLIHGIDILSLFNYKYLNIENLEVVDPEFQIRGSEILNEKDSLRVFDKVFLDLFPAFERYLKVINIQRISFIDANYGFYSNTGVKTQISKAGKISMVITGFRTEPSLIERKHDFFDSEDIMIKMFDFRNIMGDSLHVVEIDTVEYSLKKSFIRADGFRLFHYAINPDKNLYKVEVPRLEIRSDNVSRFSFNDSIKVHFIEFENPKIRFIQKENPVRIKIEDINNFDLYSLIKNQFSVVAIDSLYLNNAQLDIFGRPDTIDYQQHFNSINITLLGFRLDSVSAVNKSKLFFANDLEMFVSGYHLRLDDKEHQFFSDSMFISTIRHTLGAKNILLKPDNTFRGKVHTDATIDCKSVFFNDIDLKKLYHSRKLNTATIEISLPKVRLLNHSEIPKEVKNKNNGMLYNLVSPYLKGVYSNNVSINNGLLKIESLKEGAVTGYFDTHFDFKLNGFSLDSASISNNDLFFYASGFDLDFSNYEMKLIDNLHKISAKRVLVASSDKQVLIDSLHLNPVVNNASEKIMRQFTRSELYDILIPQISLTGIDLRNAFFNNTLIINNFQISDPEIYIENFGLLRNTKEKKQLKEFYQLIFNYISDFNIKDLEIPKGKLTWISHSKKGKTTTFDNEFSAKLENFRLNENELDKKRLFFSDDFEISVKDQVYLLSDSLYILKAGQIGLSSKKEMARIRNAELLPVNNDMLITNPKSSFKVNIPEILVEKIDFEKAWFSKDVKLDRVHLLSPNILIYSKSGLQKQLDFKRFSFPLPSFVNSLSVKEFSIENGEITIFETDGRQQKKLSNFKADIKVPSLLIQNNASNVLQLNSSNLVARLSNFNTSLGENHHIEIEGIHYNRQLKSIQINSLNVKPSNSDHSSDKISFFAPKISFSGFDMDEALQNNYFIFKNISVQESKIKIEINNPTKQNKTKKLGDLDLFSYVEPYVDGISISQLSVPEAGVTLKIKDKTLIDRKLNLNFQEIEMSDKKSQKSLFNTREIEITTYGLNIPFKNGLHELTSGSVTYNSLKHNILLKDLYVHPLFTKEEFDKKTGFQNDYIHSFTNHIEIKGFLENRYLNENVLDFDCLEIGKSKINILKDRRLPFNQNRRPPMPQELLNQSGFTFSADSVKLFPSELVYTEFTDISNDSGSISFSDLILKTGKISNSSNSKSNNLTINASCLFQNLYPLKAKIIFDLADKNFHHAVSGSLGPMPMISLNSFLKNTTGVTIEPGDIKVLDFDFILNRNEATGQLIFAYDNFKINIMDTRGDELRKAKLASLWANTIIINSKNPKGNKLEPTAVIYKRDEKRFIINYWFKTILTGIKETIGIKSQESK